MGIAMCHFELAAKTAGIDGEWAAENPDMAQLTKGTEYIASWRLGKADA